MAVGFCQMSYLHLIWPQGYSLLVNSLNYTDWSSLKQTYIPTIKPIWSWHSIFLHIAGFSLVEFCLGVLYVHEAPCFHFPGSPVSWGSLTFVAWCPINTVVSCLLSSSWDVSGGKENPFLIPQLIWTWRSSGLTFSSLKRGVLGYQIQLWSAWVSQKLPFLTKWGRVFPVPYHVHLERSNLPFSCNAFRLLWLLWHLSATQRFQGLHQCTNRRKRDTMFFFPFYLFGNSC